VPAIGSPDDVASYRLAEQRLWHSLDLEPLDRTIELGRLGTTVRVQEVGDGEPLVFVHGGPNAGTTWAPLVAHLPGVRSIMVDRPGTGLSAALPITARGLDHFADTFLIDLLDALGVDRADVVASSFGGFLALRAAAIDPSRLDRMVQMACPAGAPGMNVPPFMRMAAIPPLRRLITKLPPNERAARSVLRQIGHGKSVDADRFSPEFMSWYLALQRHTDTMENEMALIGSIVSAGGSMHRSLEMSTDLLRRVEVPTHFYWGADDPFGGGDVARATVDAMADARVEMVADAGHLPWLDDPARAARSVAVFLGADRGVSGRVES
jgi:3-oxoadipate enol-lactonase